jgi:hypothetical protein
MDTLPRDRLRTVLSVLGVLFACISLFFLYYTARLLYVMRALHGIRAGGEGAYVGAIVFPLLAAGCAWVSWRAFSRVVRGR